MGKVVPGKCKDRGRGHNFISEKVKFMLKRHWKKQGLFIMFKVTIHNEVEVTF